VSRPVRVQPDAGAIVAGLVPRDEALWVVGQYLLGHTNDLLRVRGGATSYGHEYGCSSTDAGLWVEHHHTKGVTIYRSYTREPRTDQEKREAAALANVRGDDGDVVVYDRETLWTAKWGPIVKLVAPHLTDDRAPLVVELLAAAQARYDHVAAEQPAWLRDMTEEQATEREANLQQWFAIEDRCYTAAAAIWDAARPRVVQEALW
jgi:hypothetical protein